MPTLALVKACPDPATGGADEPGAEGSCCKVRILALYMTRLYAWIFQRPIIFSSNASWGWVRMTWDHLHSSMSSCSAAHIRSIPAMSAIWVTSSGQRCGNSLKCARRFGRRLAVFLLILFGNKPGQTCHIAPAWSFPCVLQCCMCCNAACAAMLHVLQCCMRSHGLDTRCRKPVMRLIRSRFGRLSGFATGGKFYFDQQSWQLRNAFLFLLMLRVNWILIRISSVGQCRRRYFHFILWAWLDSDIWEQKLHNATQHEW